MIGFRRNRSMERAMSEHPRRPCHASSARRRSSANPAGPSTSAYASAAPATAPRSPRNSVSKSQRASPIGSGRAAAAGPQVQLAESVRQVVQRRGLGDLGRAVLEVPHRPLAQVDDLGRVAVVEQGLDVVDDVVDSGRPAAGALARRRIGGGEPERGRQPSCRRPGRARERSARPAGRTGSCNTLALMLGSMTRGCQRVGVRCSSGVLSFGIGPTGRFPRTERGR